MIGIELSNDYVSALVPSRVPTGNKSTFGKVLIVAGSKYMPGALTLATSGALNSGVGLVQVFAVEEALLPVSINCPCALLSSYESTVASSLRKASELLSAGVKSVVIGPGLDIADERNRALLEFFIHNAPRLLIDASALGILAEIPVELRRDMLAGRIKGGLEPAVLTPHIGEFKRFGFDGDEEHLEMEATKFALDNECIIVLKNHKTVINTQNAECYINRGCNSGMAKGGSGDVLSGLIGGFMASGFGNKEATVAGVYVHSLSGRLASSNLTTMAMLPTDVVDYLPEAYKELGW